MHEVFPRIKSELVAIALFGGFAIILIAAIVNGGGNLYFTKQLRNNFSLILTVFDPLGENLYAFNIALAGRVRVTEEYAGGYLTIAAARFQVQEAAEDMRKATALLEKIGYFPSDIFKRLAEQIEALTQVEEEIYVYENRDQLSTLGADLMREYDERVEEAVVMASNMLIVVQKEREAEVVRNVNTLNNFGRLGIALNITTLVLLLVIVGLTSSRFRKYTRTIIEKMTIIKNEEEKTRSLLESIGDGVVAIDKEFNIILWNRAATSISGWQKDETVGKPLRNILRLVRERDRTENYRFIEEAMILKRATTMENGTVLIAKDGREVSVADSAAPIFDEAGNLNGVIIVFRDVSKELEAQRLRSDFSYAPHQLRTPINQALWTVENAQSAQTFEEMKEGLRISYLSLRTIQKIVSQLIEVSDLDQGMVMPKRETVKLLPLFEETIETLGQEAQVRNIIFSAPSIPVDASIETDQKLFKRILAEVLENAVYYTSAYGRVDVSVSFTDDGILIEVKDDGMGILEEQRALVFTKFFRGSNFDTTKIIGAGLGLYIAKNCVRLLGGKIWFTSKEGKGTVFYIFLPLGK